MTAIRHPILDRHRDHPVMPADSAHFTLGPGQQVHADVLLTDPNWALYCYDFSNQTALFLDREPDVDLSAAPFVYDRQFRSARNALVVPFADLPALTEAAVKPAKTLLIFSTGRCGSTLFSRVLQTIPGVWSLSEPDAFTNLAAQRHTLPKELTETLLHAALAFSYRPASPQSIFAVKFRSEVSFHMQAHLETFPNAVACFLHRDLEGFANSSYKFAQRLGFDPSPKSFEEICELWAQISNGEPPDILNDLVTDKSAPVGVEVFMAARWIDRIEALLAAQDAGHAPHLVSYAAMTDAPARAFGPLLAALDLPLAALDAAASVFAVDSQKGTAGASDIAAEPLSPAQYAALNALRHAAPRLARTEARLKSPPATS